MATRFVFPHTSLRQLQHDLIENFPPHIEVELKEGKTTEIRIREGLWRGAALRAWNGNEKQTLSALLSYRVPTFAAKVVIFVISAALISLVFTVVISIAIGEFTPVGAIGGLLGIGMYGNIETLFLWRIRRAWSAMLESIITAVGGERSA